MRRRIKTTKSLTERKISFELTERDWQITVSLDDLPKTALIDLALRGVNQYVRDGAIIQTLNGTVEELENAIREQCYKLYDL